MLTVIGSIFSLLLGVAILLVGIGLLGTLLAVRAGVEHFSDTVTGVVMSAYFLGFAAGTYICPALIRRVGHIRAFAAMAAVASAAAIGHALLVHPITWAVLRVITGACMVGLYMVIESWLNVLAPSQRRGRIFAFYVAVTLVALALGQFLILVGDVDQFVPFGIAAALLSLALVPIALTRVAQPEPVEAPELGLRHLYQLSPLGTLGALAAGLVSGAFWGMGPLYAYRVGLSDFSVAGFMAATIFGGALLQWPVGHLSDHHDRRMVLTTVCFLGAALAVLIGVAAHVSPRLLFACAFLYGGLAFTVYGLSVAHVNDYLEPAQVLEATRGLLLLYGVGATLGPSTGGVVMARIGPDGLPAGFALALGLLGVFALYRMRQSAAVPTEAQGAFVPMVRTSQAALELDPRAEVEPELDL
jgi:MFS family permease